MPIDDNSIQTLTALVITHNRRDDLKICLDSIHDQDFPSVEIIVVDNKSTDGTATMIREEYPDLNYVGLEENRGIAARNRGAREATGDLIVTLDDDSELPASTVFSRIAEKFENNTKLGAAGFRLINEDGDEQEWFTWPREGNLQVGFKSPTFVACGAAIRPEMFERTGGFWEPYFMHLEEQDFAARILDSGSEVRYFPTISIVHRSREARREDSRFIYYRTRNTFWYLWRNFPLSVALWRTCLAVFALGWMALRKGGFGRYLKGLWDVRVSFGEAWRTRKPVSYGRLPWIAGRFEPTAPGEQPP